MIEMILLIVLWVLYTGALGKFLFYICSLPPVPLFDVNSTGMCAGFVLALAGWIVFSIALVSYLFGW